MPTAPRSGTAIPSGEPYPAEPSFARPPGRERELDAPAVQSLVDAAPDGILMVDEEGSILFANHQAGELFGVPSDELLGRSVDDLLPERFRRVHRAHRTRYRAEPRVRTMGAGLQLFGCRADGSEFPVEISLSPLPDDGALRVVAVVRDVTDRMRAEARQREVREALDATRDAVMILDAETRRFTYVNDGASAQVGYTRDELLRMTMLHLTPEFTERQLRELLEPLARGDQSSITFTTLHRHRDGTDVPVEILMQAIPGDDGRPVRYVKIVRDISERLDAEQRLVRAEQDLRVVEDRERIARDLHDIVIQQLFAAGMTVQSVAARAAEGEHARRLNGVVDDLDRTIREIRTVIFSLHADSTDGPGVRAAILRIADEELEPVGLQARVNFDGPVDTMADGVATELLPAVREALSNVARHAAASAVEIGVTAGDDVTLRVVDDGCGLPETVAGGNGLRNLSARAEKLGGRCLVTTRPGGGTVLEWQVPNRS